MLPQLFKSPLLIMSATALMSAGTASAGIANYTQAMIDRCTVDGEDAAVCQCAVDQWRQGVTASNEQAAIAMAQLMANNTPPQPGQMMQIQPELTRFQQAGMQCAYSVAYEEKEEETISISSVIPGLENASGYDALLNARSGDDAMAAINALQKQTELQDIEKQKQRKAKAAAERAEREKKERAYKAAIAKVDEKSIIYASTEDFKHAFYKLRQLSNDKTASMIDCEWQAVSNAAGNDKAGKLMMDWVLRGGDYDHPPLLRPYRDGASAKYKQYQNNAKSCF